MSTNENEIDTEEETEPMDGQEKTLAIFFICTAAILVALIVSQPTGCISKDEADARRAHELKMEQLRRQPLIPAVDAGVEAVPSTVN